MANPIEQARIRVQSGLKRIVQGSMLDGDNFFADKNAGSENSINNPTTRKVGRIVATAIVCNIPIVLMSVLIPNKEAAGFVAFVAGPVTGYAAGTAVNRLLGGRGSAARNEARRTAMQSRSEDLDALTQKIATEIGYEATKNLPMDELVARAKRLPHGSNARRTMDNIIQMRRDTLLRN